MLKRSGACHVNSIFENTGIQFMEVNTLYQLLAMVVRKSPLLEVARTFLTIPDLFNYWLTGKMTCEFTNATTTQCFDPHKRDWARPLLAGNGHPGTSFPASDRTGHGDRQPGARRGK